MLNPGNANNWIRLIETFWNNLPKGWKVFFIASKKMFIGVFIGGGSVALVTLTLLPWIEAKQEKWAQIEQMPTKEDYQELTKAIENSIFGLHQGIDTIYLSVEQLGRSVTTLIDFEKQRAIKESKSNQELFEKLEQLNKIKTNPKPEHRINVEKSNLHR